MSDKTPISNASTYQEIGIFWDEHDATEFGEQTDTTFQINIASQHRYYPLAMDLAFKIKKIAKQQGIHEATLLNIWIQEKIDQIYVIE
ncbi:hypothetical protein TI05_08660 [Achromatium sp. WMS3]|nr:hypothetical protein TI05_08660 [Achromatium sp. WMS3]